MNDNSGNGKTEGGKGHATASNLKAVLTAAKSETQQLEHDMEQLNLQIAAAHDKEDTRRVLGSRIEAAKQAEDDRKIQRAPAIETLNAAEALASIRCTRQGTPELHLASTFTGLAGPSTACSREQQQPVPTTISQSAEGERGSTTRLAFD